MAKKVPLIISLLALIILAGMLTQAAVAAPAADVVAQNQAAKNVKLTVEDLPRGFRKLPPTVTAQIADKLLQAFRQQLPQADLKPENFVAFVNPQNFQFVMGVSGNFPKQSDEASFDESLQQLEKPVQQQQMFSQLQQSFKSFPGVEIVDYTALANLNKLGNASTGFTIDVTIQGQPMQMDIATFRRNSGAGLTAVMYPNGQSPVVSVADVAGKLLDRLVQPKAY